MSNSLFSKMVVSGQYVEFYEFEIPVSLNRRVVDRKKKEDCPDWLKIQNRRVSLLRTSKKLKRFIYSNPDMFRFLTLTYAGNFTDVSYCNKQFNLFTKRLRYKYPDIKYIAVIEFQKRGAVHYHLLVDRYIHYSEYRKLWTYGFIYIEKVFNMQGVLYYLQKYMKKIDPKDRRLWGRKVYFTSRNLNKPVEVSNASYSDLEKVCCGFMAGNIMKTANRDYKIYQSSYFSDFLGRINYFAINLF
jgi:hypothetical protein